MIYIKDSFFRTKILIGEEKFEKLKNSHVSIFGLGGVGSYAAEAIARSGVQNIDLFDFDVVDVTNINRQLIATHETVGKFKVDVMKERILKINEEADVMVHKIFFNDSVLQDIDFSKYDYIIDAIDTISSKILLISEAKKQGVKIISCMGTGNKLNPVLFEVSDIYKTSICPLARVMRRELKKRNINSLKVVYSKEKPVYTPDSTQTENSKRVNASISFVPPVAGMILASEVVNDIIGDSNEGVQ